MKTTSTIALGILAVLMLQTKVVFPLAEAEMDPFTSDEAEMELSAWAEAEMDTFIEEAETELEPAEAETELEPAEAETELEPAEAETESSTSAEMETYPQCAPPICPHGSIYDKRRCTCITTKTRPSTCPRGFKPIIRNRRCICVRITKPFCKGGTYLDKNCRCTIKVPPSCPSGTTISPRYALCTGSTEAMCRRGANLVPKRCACVEYRSRICPRGTKLSRNGCRCVSTVRTTPRCPNRGCFLNSKTCTCRPRIACYRSKTCYGFQVPVYTIKQCCANRGRWYKTSANGLCIRCPYFQDHADQQNTE